MAADPTPDLADDLDGIVGRHFIYTYATGWRYEMYVKNSTTIDYRIHSGMVGGRWVKDQTVDLARIAEDIYTVSWDEPTGTQVSVTVLPGLRRLRGVIFFPQWVHRHPERTVCFQNDHLGLMHRYRDEGPTYPIVVVAEFARITFMETCQENDETIIAVAPSDLPREYAERLN
jgi:phenolic acid decarboxylase